MLELRVVGTTAQLASLSAALLSSDAATPVRHAVWQLNEPLPLEWFEAQAKTTGPFDYAQVAPGTTLESFSLLAMDMDSTLITIECIDEIADFCGKKVEVSAITEATMRGEIKSFEESLRKRVGILAGVSANALESVYTERLRLSPGAQQLLTQVRDAGLQTLLVSGGFTFFTERLKARLDLNEAHANTLGIAEGVLTGKVLGPVVDAQAKANFLLATCARLGVSPKRAIAAGDGSNDLLMMAESGLSVAFHAKPVVRAQACVVINQGGLDRLVELLKC
jgi:phosphoserine phosphatase